MRGSKTQNTSHTEVIKALRRLFDAEYPEGGWLPPGREMAKRLGVSHLTYCKALKHMVVEGLASSFPQRGHHVAPADLRCHKVGFIHFDGQIPPCLSARFAPVLQWLGDNGFHFQSILASSLEKLHDEAIVRGVEALLWVSAPVKAAKAIKQIQASGDLPLVLAMPQQLSLEELPGVGVVSYDLEQIGAARAKFMLARGHRGVAFVGDLNSAESSGLAAELRSGGVELGPERCVADIDNCPGKLTRLLRRHDITGIVSEGGVTQVANLFAELSALQGEAQPEVLAYYIPELAHLAAKYPKVKLLSPPWKLQETPELAATKMLVRHLTTGSKLGLVKVGVSYQP